MSEELSSSQQGEKGRLSELALLLLGLCAKVALAGARCASSFLVSMLPCHTDDRFSQEVPAPMLGYGQGLPLKVVDDSCHVTFRHHCGHSSDGRG